MEEFESIESKACGVSSFHPKASVKKIILSHLIDLFIFLIIYCVLVLTVFTSPLISFGETLILLILFLLIQSFFILNLKVTFGQKLFHLINQTKSNFPYFTIHEQSQNSFVKSALSYSFLSMITFTCFVLFNFLFSHPYLSAVTTTHLSKKSLASSENNKWIMLPFFYTLGAWPKEYRGRPVLFSLPYEKGPPKKFAGHIFAHWNETQTQITLEGPKTSVSIKNINEIKKCFENETPNLACADIREKVLSRHLLEMKNELNILAPWKIKTKWLEVNHKKSSKKNQPQGVYLSANQLNHYQDRFILFNSSGTQQAIILDRKDPNDLKIPLELFQQTLYQLSVFSELKPGRAWIDRALAKTQMETNQTHPSPLESIKQLAEAQAKLIAKISVDPKSLNSYFHLGGTALMIAQKSFEIRNQKQQKLTPQVDSLLHHWSVVSKPLVFTAYRYAKDVDINHSNTTRLQNIWIESQKY